MFARRLKLRPAYQILHQPWLILIPGLGCFNFLANRWTPHSPNISTRHQLRVNCYIMQRLKKLVNFLQTFSEQSCHTLEIAVSVQSYTVDSPFQEKFMGHTIMKLPLIIAHHRHMRWALSLVHVLPLAEVRCSNSSSATTPTPPTSIMAFLKNVTRT